MSNKHHSRRQVVREPREVKALPAPKTVALAEPQITDLQRMQWEFERLQETITELQLQREDVGWVQLAGGTAWEFSRDELATVARLAWLNWLKNPLIGRGVSVQAHYVFGQGMTVHAEDEEVNACVQAFMDDAKNQAELTGHQARLLKDQELCVFGNLFFVFFTNKANGRVRVRTIPLEEIADIICDPEDAKSPWYYKRQWTQRNADGTSTPKTAYYPDWHYRPSQRPSALNSYQILWDNPVYHVKVGAIGSMRFGVPEVYSALDWAKAYKNFLEDWATLTRAYSRFAHVLSTTGGARGVAAAKARLNTTIGTSTDETNPPPVTGSTFIAGEGTSLTPYRIGGANVSAEDGRRLLLMVAAGLGLPETFFGDVSVGTLATATSMDRPTELKMRSRQTFWGDIHRAILGFAVEQSARAPGGVVKGTVIEDDDGEPTVVLGAATDGEQIERDATITVEFPPLLEHDVLAQVSAIVDAATLKGSQLADISDPKTVARLLLSALSVPDVDAVLDILWPPDEEYDGSVSGRAEERQAQADAIAQGIAQTAQAPEMAEAARGLRGALQRLMERFKGVNNGLSE